MSNISKYVISDLHGCYDEFMQMLELIEFNIADELYILGDVLDRGPKPLEIIDYITSNKNIHLLKGNHELMMQEYYEDHKSFDIWYHNGGQVTLNGILQKDIEYEPALYNYIKSLPIIKVVDKFILVHAGLYLPKKYNDLSLEELLELQEEDINLWTRSYIYSDKQFKDYKIICGHNTVQSIKRENKDPKIIHRKGHIFIDCGCVFKKANGKLSCLRLDDMRDFYIE